jgi:protein involved in polysaccharide export with SLBB domain
MHTSILVITVASLGFSYSHAVIAQTTRPKPQSQIEIKNPNEPGRAASSSATASTDRIGTARKFYEQGRDLLEAGRLPEAAERLKEAVQFDPEYADAYSALGRTYFKLREWQKAVDNFNRAAALNTRQRNANETALQRPSAEKQKFANPSPSIEAATTSPKTGPYFNQTRAPAFPSSHPNEQAKTVNIQINPVQTGRSAATPTSSPVTSRDSSKTTNIENKPVQPSNFASAPTSKQAINRESNKTVNIESKPVQPNPVATPTPSQVANRNLLNQTAREIASSRQDAALTVDVKTLLPQLSESPEQEQIKKTAIPLKNDSTGQLAGSTPQVNAPKETPHIPDGPSGMSKPANINVSEQTAIATRVSEPVTTVPAINETGSEILPVARVPETALTKVYRVGPNDVLDVRLNEAPSQLSTLYTVTPAGMLEHPLLNEPMVVAGLTAEEIGSRIEDDLRKRAIVETPKALVGVRDYASHTVLVSGLVKDSGTKFLRREAIPLYVVVADAQPLPEATKVTVVRADKNQIYEIDLSQAADMNFLVRSGDVITLRPAATEFVYLGGEIKFPGEKTFRRGLTLMQVILASGGITPKAKTAEIARNNEEGFLIPTRVKLKDLVAGKAADPVLRPGDRISILR